MSLPSLLPVPDLFLACASRAEADFASTQRAQGLEVMAVPESLHEAFARVSAMSDFVAEQVTREPLLLLDPLVAGLLGRSLQAGEMRSMLQVQLAGCEEEDDLGRRLRRFRNRQQVRIIWRDVNRQAALVETCRDLSDMATFWLQASASTCARIASASQVR
jgi:glutamate-ammonia-ligase adenylyltransferase